MVEERLCGLPPPKSAQSLVDVWRPWIEERAGKTLERMGRSAKIRRRSGACCATSCAS